MFNGHPVLDADRHVLEPIGLWPEYLEPAFRDRAPRLQPFSPPEPLADRVARLGEHALVPMPPMPTVDGRPLFHQETEVAWQEASRSGIERIARHGGYWTAEGHLAHMDRTGIDVALLFPTFASVMMGMDGLEPAFAAALASAYNRWLRDFCRAAPDRFRGVGLVARHDPARMVEGLEEVREIGFRTVVLRPNPIAGRTLADPAYEPFWAACEGHGVSVALHEGGPVWAPAAGADRFSSHFARHACSHPMEQMMAFLALLEGGVFERHPTLRFAFLEAGAGWLPYWLWRLDEVEYRLLAREVAGRVCRKPSEYFHRQCFIALEAGEPGIVTQIDRIGADNLIYGTDFPHLDHEDDSMEAVLREGLGGAATLLRRVLYDNPARFYGICFPPREG